MTKTEPVSVIRWEDPPPAKGNPWTGRSSASKYDKLALNLIAKPGQWAVIREGDRRNPMDQLASAIRAGRLRCFAPAGDFDARTRAIPGGYGLFICYLGDGAA